jgi:hypothetical protein
MLKIKDGWWKLLQNLVLASFICLEINAQSFWTQNIITGASCHSLWNQLRWYFYLWTKGSFGIIGSDINNHSEKRELSRVGHVNGRGVGGIFNCPDIIF